MCRTPRRRTLPIALSLLIAGSAATATPVTSSAFAAPPPATTVHPYAAHVGEAAARFSLSEDLIWAVMRAESAGNPRASGR